MIDAKRSKISDNLRISPINSLDESIAILRKNLYSELLKADEVMLRLCVLESLWKISVGSLAHIQTPFFISPMTLTIFEIAN